MQRPGGVARQRRDFRRGLSTLNSGPSRSRHVEREGQLPLLEIGEARAHFDLGSTAPARP